jgi:N4-gp56 family major capsid protein
MNKNLYKLQIFAEAGDLVNTTGGYTNAYTGVVTPFDSVNTLAPELKAFYDTTLLENARTELIYAQFAKRQPLPRGHKGQVEWRKWNSFANAGQLQEGVIPDPQKFGVSYLTGSINQYGTYTAISDVLELRAYDDLILGATEEMGASAAKTQEELIRDALMVGTNVLYCDNLTLATGVPHDTPTNERELKADDTYRSVLTPTMINKAVTILKKNKVPRIRGKYVAVIHPSVAEDLRESKGWTESHKYDASTEIFNGEIGELHGVRFVENPDAPVLKGADLAEDSRTLKLATATSSGTAVTSLVFNAAATVAADALKDRYISLGGKIVKVTSNTASSGTHTITIPSTDFGTNALGTEIFPAEYGAGDIAAYATFFFGKDAFGIIDPEGGGLEMIIHDKGEIGGPLDQFSTIGYKFETNGATILYQERMLRVMSCSASSDVDEAN